jgi:hypothetical protein
MNSTRKYKISTTRVSTRKISRAQSLRKVFGEIILKKGCILYHTSQEPFTYRASKPMLFCVFHPSEWEHINDYVTRIELLRDISLLFMIDNFKKTHVFSALNGLINKPGLNLAKMFDGNLACYSQKLREERFDGWFSSIENKGSVEIALLNDPSIFSYSSSETLKRNWRNSNNINNTITTKNWGNLYPICTLKQPVILNIHERFRAPIESYIENNKTSDFPNDFIFQILLSNAIISYHTSPVVFKRWVC